MLTKTWVLMKEYGNKLRDGTISDLELSKLLAEDTFKRSDGENILDPNVISDSNHTAENAINDFVRVVGHNLEPVMLHNITARMIDLAPISGPRTFMRNATLEKAFLAYELMKDAEFAEEHFNSARIQREFSSSEAINYLKFGILQQLVTHFTSPSTVQSREDFRVEGDYIYALQQLQAKVDIESSADIRDKAQKVIDYVKTMKPYRRSRIPVSELTSALTNTYKLLNSDMSVEQFNSEAKKVQGSNNFSIQVLGGVLFALGAAMLIAGTVLLATGVATAAGVGLTLGGSAAAVLGLGFFVGSKWEPRTHNNLNDVSKAVVAEIKANKSSDDEPERLTMQV